MGKRDSSETRRGHALFDSAIGPCGVVWSEHGIVRIQLPEATRADTLARLAADGDSVASRPPPAVARAIARLTRHLDGKLQDLSGVPLDVSALAPFRQQVYAAARAVPAGRTATYGEIAGDIEMPNAARAIGRALGVNPFPIVVPCHRIRAANGGTGGFSAYGGVATKARLLAIEGVDLVAPSPPAAARKPGRAPDFDSAAAILHLRRTDPRLGAMIDRIGPFTMETQRAHDIFAALARAIVYQQLHGKAAATIFGRFLALYPGRRFPAPDDVLATPEETLRAVGLSRNKQLAIRDLAEKVRSGVVPTAAALRRMSDDTVVERLTEVRGIGRWTAEMLLMFKLGRPDVLPVDDFGVRKGWSVVQRRKEMPTPAELLRHGERWRPYRTVASWYLWRAADLGQATNDKKKE